MDKLYSQLVESFAWSGFIFPLQMTIVGSSEQYAFMNLSISVQENCHYTNNQHKALTFRRQLVSWSKYQQLHYQISRRLCWISNKK